MGEVRLLRSEEAVASRVVVEVGEAVGCVGGGCGVDEEALACCCCCCVYCDCGCGGCC